MLIPTMPAFTRCLNSRADFPERVKMEAFETRLKLDLLDTEEGLSEVARKSRAELLRRRYETLIRSADELRELALNIEGKIKVAQAK